VSELTDNQWQAAHAIARMIVQEGANAGELKKAMAYLRTCTGDSEDSDGGDRFFKYLGNLVRGGNNIGHSKRTLGYYSILNDACLKYLKELQDSPRTMLEILGWAGRLISYYQASPIAELMEAPMDITIQSTKQAERAAAAAEVGFNVGLVVTATVRSIKGKEVTYELPGEIRLTQKEPRKAQDLAVAMTVQVEVIEMRESGLPKKVKLQG
jgi:hypothetical protein